MSRLWIYTRRHWQALLVVLFLLWRMWRDGLQSGPALWLAAGLIVLGMALNLLVIFVNDGMPARVSAEEIGDDERLHYHPLSESTRLAVLSDWIPVGSLLVSPGDILLFVAAAILVLQTVFAV
uniref:Uncharacterized protein n=1 Tax=Schlesneria paludicola TaxID=360056 RepID=A0A7C2NYL0_9PLAN